jgi:hypothetical protein
VLGVLFAPAQQLRGARPARTAALRRQETGDDSSWPQMSPVGVSILDNQENGDAQKQAAICQIPGRRSWCVRRDCITRRQRRVRPTPIFSTPIFGCQPLVTGDGALQVPIYSLNGWKARMNVTIFRRPMNCRGRPVQPAAVWTGPLVKYWQVPILTNWIPTTARACGWDSGLGRRTQAVPLFQPAGRNHYPDYAHYANGYLHRRQSRGLCRCGL